MVPALRSLRSRNYRIFLAGQGICLISLWCQRIAMIWLVYRTTESPLLLGLAAFAAEIPFLLVAPFGGLIADRVNRRHALMTVQLVAAMQAFALAALVTLDAAPYGVLLLLGMLLGVCQAIETPVRQSMFPDLVESAADIPNAVALMAFMNNAGRLAGPVVAGFIVAATGESVCFALSGLSFLAVMFAVWRVELRAGAVRSAGNARVVGQLKSGFAYAWNDAPIRRALGMLAVMSFCGLPYLVVMPVFSREVLNADAPTLGMLLSCAGAGGLAGLVAIGLRTTTSHRFPRIISIATLVGAASLLACSLAHTFIAAAVAMTLLGYGIVVTATAVNIYLQFQSEPDKRGRVLGLFSTVFFGFAPLGNLVAGVIGDHFGGKTALGFLGVAAGLAWAAIAFAWRRELLSGRTDPSAR